MSSAQTAAIPRFNARHFAWAPSLLVFVVVLAIYWSSPAAQTGSDTIYSIPHGAAQTALMIVVSPRDRDAGTYDLGNLVFTATRTGSPSAQLGRLVIPLRLGVWEHAYFVPVMLR